LILTAGLQLCSTGCTREAGSIVIDSSPVAIDAKNDGNEGDPVVELTSVEITNHFAEHQTTAVANEYAPWGHWGMNPNRYRDLDSHSSRLIPCYVFGGDLAEYRDEKSVYRDAKRLKELFGREPRETLDENATHFDQTDVYRLQMAAVAAGKKYIILFVFDGMDWQSTLCGAIAKTGKVPYTSGRGTGLLFQDYRGAPTDFGFFVTSELHSDSEVDLNRQRLVRHKDELGGGYNASLGGAAPWQRPASPEYLLGKYRNLPHLVPESSATGTSMTSGIKTFNYAINVDVNGKEAVPIARMLQERGFQIGVVTSVPFCHATPAAAYANNVGRYDYQDISRDLVGLNSAFHNDVPLAGVDVLIGAGWGVSKDDDRTNQGKNYVPGNMYLTAHDFSSIDDDQGGKYVVAQRTEGKSGVEVLQNAAASAIGANRRLFGWFGTSHSHLPFRTADGNFDPVAGRAKAETYKPADISENPELKDLTRTALDVLWARGQESGFWLMVEAGDVDWANHDNNIDNSAGAVISGDLAFQEITAWAEANGCWDETLVVVTADHGHFLVLNDPSALLTQPVKSGTSE